MTIKTDKVELRRKLNELKIEMKREDANRYIMSTLIEDIRILCKRIDNSNALSTKRLTSRGYNLVDKATEKIIKMLGY